MFFFRAKNKERENPRKKEGKKRIKQDQKMEDAENEPQEEEEEQEDKGKDEKKDEPQEEKTTSKDSSVHKTNVYWSECGADAVPLKDKYIRAWLQRELVTLLFGEIPARRKAQPLYKKKKGRRYGEMFEKYMQRLEEEAKEAVERELHDHPGKLFYGCFPKSLNKSDLPSLHDGRNLPLLFDKTDGQRYWFFCGTYKGPLESDTRFQMRCIRLALLINRKDEMFRCDRVPCMNAFYKGTLLDGEMTLLQKHDQFSFEVFDVAKLSGETVGHLGLAARMQHLENTVALWSFAFSSSTTVSTSTASISTLEHSSPGPCPTSPSFAPHSPSFAPRSPTSPVTPVTPVTPTFSPLAMEAEQPVEEETTTTTKKEQTVEDWLKELARSTSPTTIVFIRTEKSDTSGTSTPPPQEQYIWRQLRVKPFYFLVDVPHLIEQRMPEQECRFGIEGIVFMPDELCFSYGTELSILKYKHTRFQTIDAAIVTCPASTEKKHGGKETKELQAYRLKISVTKEEKQTKVVLYGRENKELVVYAYSLWPTSICRELKLNSTNKQIIVECQWSLEHQLWMPLQLRDKNQPNSVSVMNQTVLHIRENLDWNDLFPFLEGTGKKVIRPIVRPDVAALRTYLLDF